MTVKCASMRECQSFGSGRNFLLERHQALASRLPAADVEGPFGSCVRPSLPLWDNAHTISLQDLLSTACQAGNNGMKSRVKNPRKMSYKRAHIRLSDPHFHQKPPCH
jgi:hypothetical protein